MLEAKCGEGDNLVGVHDKASMEADIVVKDMVTLVLKDDNTLSDVVIVDGNMIGSTHVSLNNLADSDLDDEATAIVSCMMLRSRFVSIFELTLIS